MENILVEQLKRKITTLFERGFKIEFGKSEKYQTDIIIIDKIKCTKDHIEGSEGARWEDEVYVDFERCPIMYGENAREIRQFMIQGSKNSLQNYLNSK